MRNPIYEQNLDRQGVKWTYLESIKLSDINEQKSLRTQARLEQVIDLDLVEQYAQAMRNDVQFPPLVVWKPSGSGARWIIIDGNQRRKAYEQAKIASCDAYQVESTDPVVIDRLTWTWNIKVNGKRLSQAECLEHAMTFVAKYGWSQKQASEEFSVRYSSLVRAMKVQEIRNSLDKNGVKHQKSSDEVMLAIAPILKAGEDVLAETGKVVASCGLGKSDADKMTTEVQQAKTHDAKLKAIEDFAKRPDILRKKAETKGGSIRPHPLPRELLARHLRNIELLSQNFTDRAAFRLPGAEGKKQRKQATEVVNWLIETLSLGAKIPQEDVG